MKVYSVIRHLLAVLLVFSMFSVQAVPLTRSTFLGIEPHNADTGQAVQIRRLAPNGTAATLGLQVDDTLTHINGTAIADFAAMAAVLSAIHEGDEVKVKLVRNGAPMTLSAPAIGRPKEQGENYRVEYGQFDWQDNSIRTITYLPNQPRKDGAALMFIQGYTCDSIDYGSIPNLTLNQLLSTVAEAGFTVFKMEKPGVGDSRGKLACSDIDFTTENRAFEAGLKHFQHTRNIALDNLFVFGHSLGVLHGAVLASKHPIKGVMGFGGVVKPWHAYIRDIYTKQSTKYWGVSAAQAERNIRTLSPFLNDWLASDKPWDEVLAQPYTQKAIEEDLVGINGEHIMNRHFSFFRDTSRYDFRQLWASTDAHVLMMHGEFDIQAVESGWQQEIAQIVNQRNPGHGSSKVMDNTDHSFMQYTSVNKLLSDMRSREYQPANPGKHYNPDIAKDSVAWMQNLLSKAKGSTAP